MRFAIGRFFVATDFLAMGLVVGVIFLVIGIVTLLGTRLLAGDFRRVLLFATRGLVASFFVPRAFVFRLALVARPLTGVMRLLLGFTGLLAARFPGETFLPVAITSVETGMAESLPSR